MESKTTSYRFDFQETEAWLKHLHEKGFVVVGNVVNQEDCLRIIEEMKECLQKMSPLLTDEKSWTVKENYPFLLHGGMIKYVGHSKFQWELREKAAPLFAKIWNCKETDLVASFDGFCFMNGKLGFEPSDPLGFAHSDQSPKRDFLWSVQGFVNLCDNDEKDGGLVIIPETHRMHQEFFKKIGKSDVQSDWYKFSKEEKQDPVFSTFIKVNGKAGDMMLWDSRTFHCNTVPTSQNLRAVVYVCELPKDRVPEEAKKKRGMAWMERKPSNHHPGDGFVIPKYDDKAQGEMAINVAIKDDELTELQKSLLYVD